MMETRKSIKRPVYRTRKRPSCGTRRSAMSRSLRTLIREMTAECQSFEMGCMACCNTPSMRYFTATSASRASMWMSLALRSSAVKITVSTSLTTGLPVVSRGARAPEIGPCVSSAALEWRENNRMGQFGDRSGGSVAGEPVTRNSLFAIFVGFGDLQCKRFRGLLEDALRLFGALQQVANLFCRGHPGSQFFPQQQRQFVAKQHQAGIGRRNHEHVVALFDGHEIVAEH